MRIIPNFIRAAAIFFIALIVISPSTALADRKIRIHFIAASFSYAEDSATNTKLVATAGRAGYDAVWEATVPSGFPTAFGHPVRIGGTGLAQLRTEDGIDNCDGELKFHEEGTYPSVSVYNINGDKFALQIVAPHAATLEDRASTSCRDPLFIVSAPGEGVSTTPDYTGIPNAPGSSSPPPISSFAAFIVDADKPETSINFSFVQTASFPQLAYTSKSVWFGSVNVELNPTTQIPGEIDPLRLFNYTPPEGFLPPADPPTPNSGGGGGEPITINDIKKWITDPVINDIRNSLQTLQQVWNTLTAGARIQAASFIDPSGNFSYDSATRQLTLFGVGAAPWDGTASVKIGVGDKRQKSAAKDIVVSAAGPKDIVLTLPKALTNSFAKGKKFPVKLTASFVSSENKKKKASVTKAFSIKKRP